MGNIAAVQNSVVTIDGIADRLKKYGYTSQLEWLNGRLFIKGSPINFNVREHGGEVLYNDDVIQMCDIFECVDFFRSFLNHAA